MNAHVQQTHLWLTSNLIQSKIDVYIELKINALLQTGKNETTCFKLTPAKSLKLLVII